MYLCKNVYTYIYIYATPPHPYSLFALRMKMQPWRMEFRCCLPESFTEQTWSALANVKGKHSKQCSCARSRKKENTCAVMNEEHADIFAKAMEAD